MSAAQRRAKVGARDGWTCTYCEVPLIAPGDEALHCARIPNLLTGPIDLLKVRIIYGTDALWLAPPDMDWPTEDHVIPVSLGGTNDLDNLVLACALCNIRKSNHEQVPA